MKLKVKRLSSEITLPGYAHPGDAGLDIYAAAETVMAPGERAQIPTGLALEIPAGYVGLIWDKSGLSHKHGLKTLGGVVDSTYRGELKIGIVNLSPQTRVFKVGDKVAQLLIQPVISVEIAEVQELSDTDRGEGGFGSTGRR